MKKINVRSVFIICLIGIRCGGIDPDENAIRQINEKYVNAWLQNDQAGVLDLFEDNATLAPSGLNSVKGKAAITNFWFPNDSSITTIHQFTNDVQFISIEKDIGYSAQKTFLSWSYLKGDYKLARDQKGLAMTIYRKQDDGHWKIIHQMWKDVESVDR